MNLLLASLVLLAQLTAATDISLSSFTPRINNLPSSCRAVYTTPIDGCVAADFSAGATCSVQCVAGLTRIGVSVKTGCSDVDVGETSIIGVFQNGLGIAALCPNNRQSTTTATSASPSTSSSSQSSTTSTSTQTSGRASTLVTTTAVPSTSSDQPSSASSSTLSSSGLNIDTTATQAASTSFKFNDPTAAPTSTRAPVNSQLSNSDSGGGSPFDVVATGGAGLVRVASLAMPIGAAAIALVAWL